ncbi:hypothetical protein G5Y03_004693, partial [Vibrio parahaemolyticus]|nr:hypothetical protein [Vibrio parahaemolyticus]
YPFYFPQLYPTVENDLWWGKGFTDWKLVESAKKNFPEHNQPRTPLLGQLDQSDPSVIKSQCELAKRYGVNGFNFYHYWFDGKVLLNKPVENLLEDKSIDFEYFFTWANENWTRQWIGDPESLLIKNTYEDNKELWNEHFLYLLKFFRDCRYTKVNNKPIFCIYRPEIIPNLNEMLDYFAELAVQNGFDGLHYIAMRAYEVFNAEAVYDKFDAIVNFQPRYAINKHLANRSKIVSKAESLARRLPEKWQAIISKRFSQKSYRVFSYSDYLETLKLSCDLVLNDKTCYQVVFPDWDNTARYSERATLFSDISNDSFRSALEIAINNVANCDNKFVFVNAWNEWSEGAYLEPDT